MHIHNQFFQTFLNKVSPSDRRCVSTAAKYMYENQKVL